MIVFTFALHGTHPTVGVALASSHTSLLPTSISYQTSQYHFVGLERRSGECEREFYLERGYVVVVREEETLNFRPYITDYVRGGAPVPALCTYIGLRTFDAPAFAMISV